MNRYTVTLEWKPIFQVTIPVETFKNLSAKQIKNIINDILGENGFKTRLNNMCTIESSAGELVKEEATANGYEVTGYIKTTKITKK